jgi:hypothetical protein
VDVPADVFRVALDEHVAAIADWGRTIRLCVILACANATLILSAWLIGRR